MTPGKISLGEKGLISQRAAVHSSMQTGSLYIRVLSAISGASSMHLIDAVNSEKKSGLT